MLEYLYTPKEVAEILKCSVTFVYDHQDELGVIRVGKLMRFPESKLKKILNIDLETQETMERQIPVERTDDAVSQRIRHTGGGQARRGRKAGKPVEDPADPYGLRRDLRESLKRFAGEEEMVI